MSDERGRKSGTRNGLIVVGVCLLISAAIGFALKSRFTGELVPTQDLVTGLIYFMEQNEGRFPASEEEFLASGLLERVAGGFRVVAPVETRYRKQTHGFVIDDLTPFAIRWGTDLTRLHVGQRGKVRDEEDEQVKLIQWPASPPSGKAYSIVLLAESRRIRAALESGAD